MSSIHSTHASSLSVLVRQSKSREKAEASLTLCRVASETTVRPSSGARSNCNTEGRRRETCRVSLLESTPGDSFPALHREVPDSGCWRFGLDRVIGNSLAVECMPCSSCTIHFHPSNIRMGWFSFFLRTLLAPDLRLRSYFCMTEFSFHASSGNPTTSFQFFVALDVLPLQSQSDSIGIDEHGWTCYRGVTLQRFEPYHR